MRVTFYRLADHQRGHSLVERDDGVVYRLDGGPVTGHLPHDLVHFTVEDAMRLSDGIWAAIAGGVVFHSMTHVSGRRPPHAAQRSVALLKAYRDRIQRAELIGGFVERLAETPGAEVVRLARQNLGTLVNDDIDLSAATRAAAALRQAQERWQSLAVGEQLTVDWPGYRRLTMVAEPARARR
jgi:hypothetical protein